MRKLVFLLALVALTASVEANFAAAPGFSGRAADCTSCHQPPLQGDDAEVLIDGVPETWMPGQAYAWTVSVLNGPETIPGGPQAGFEVEVLAGTLAPGPAANGDVRTFHPKQATYTETGVRQRAWSVAWNAPDLATYPAPVTVWVAGMAANGNHNTDLNRSDLGEHGDSVATRSYTIPPAPAAIAAWQALPLATPIIDEVRGTNGRYTIEGRFEDANATTLEIHDGSRWITRPVGPVWQLKIQGDADVRLRASGMERVSDEIVVSLGDGQVRNATDVPVRDEASPGPAAIIPLLVALLARRRL